MVLGVPILKHFRVQLIIQLNYVHFIITIIMKNTVHVRVAFEDKSGIRALDKRDYLLIIRDTFYLFWLKIYVVTPHLNCLIEMVQIRSHSIWFH